MYICIYVDVCVSMYVCMSKPLVLAKCREILSVLGVSGFSWGVRFRSAPVGSQMIMSTPCVPKSSVGFVGYPNI